MIVKAKQLENYATSYTVSFVSGRKSVNTTGQIVIGSAIFDPSILPADGRIITWNVVLQSSDGYVEAQMELFNFTDGSTVTDSVLTSDSQNQESLSAILTVPADLPNASKIYEVRLNMDSQPDAEFVICYKADLIVTWG